MTASLVVVASSPTLVFSPPEGAADHGLRVRFPCWTIMTMSCLISGGRSLASSSSPGRGNLFEGLTLRKAKANMDRVMCPYQQSYCLTR